MAWLESHQSLLNHHKTRKAARMLEMPRVHLCGHLHALWWWAIDYAEDGDVTAFDAADLADASEYTGDAEAFIAALTDCGPGGKHGFLERTDDGRLVIHDWYEYAGKLIERRKADRERKQSSRRPTDTAPSIEDVQRTSGGSLTDTAPVPYVTVTNSNQPTVTESDQPEDGVRASAPPNADAALFAAEMADILVAASFVGDGEAEVRRQVIRLFGMVPDFAPRDGPALAELFANWKEYRRKPPDRWHLALLQWMRKEVRDRNKVPTPLRPVRDDDDPITDALVARNGRAVINAYE